MTRVRRFAVLAPVVVALAALVAPAQALPGQWSIPLDQIEGTGNIAWDLAPAGNPNNTLNVFALKVDAPSADDYGAVGLALPNGTLLSDITKLSFDSYFVTGDCGGGAPRVSLRVDTNFDGQADGSVFAYAGALPNFDGCTTGGWESHDLLDGASRIDSTQIGGPFYGTLADAVAAAGPFATVLRATFVFDSTWKVGPTQVFLDNLRVNDFDLAEPVVGHSCSLASGLTGLPACPSL